jgi:hypothetical protein
MAGNTSTAHDTVTIAATMMRLVMGVSPFIDVFYNFMIMDANMNRRSRESSRKRRAQCKAPAA